MKQFYVSFTCTLKRSSSLRLLCSMPLIMLLTCTAAAQVGSVSSIPQPMTPEAAALGKFVEVPVSNYSGLPEINVPIYNFKTKYMDVPISLSYHASGVKVKEIPSWVGANLALTAGGVITRVVRGTPDRETYNPNYYKKYVEQLDDPGYYWPDPREMPNITAEGSYAKVDTEFDVFYYNFMGHAGRFTFNSAGEPMMLDVGEVKVKSNTEFTLIDKEGVEYEFLETSYSPEPGFYPYASSWYLTKIRMPHQSETINFSYRSYSNFDLYRVHYASGSFYTRTLYQDVYPPYGSVQNPACVSNGSADEPSLAQGNVSVLQTISYKGDSVRFYHDTSRADVYKLRLDSIRVFQGATPVHTSRLFYSFSNAGSSDPRDKKMLLDSVQSNDQPPYTFTYYGSFNGKSLPGAYIYGADLWGYYNGGSYTTYTLVTMPHHPDYRYGQIGSLQTLTYPTGGRTEFTYEGNDFSYCQNQLDSVGPIYQAGGLRIKKIKFISPQGGSSSFEKTYEYTYGGKSSGVLEVPFANKTTSFYWGQGRQLGNPYCYSDSWPQICSFYHTYHDNVIPLGNAQGGAIGYAQVIEHNSDGSKKVMQYTNGGLDYLNYDSLFDGWADGYNNDYLGDIQIQDRLTYDYSSRRGKLKNAAYYNSSGVKLKQEVHQFSDLIEDRLTFMQRPGNNNFYAMIREVPDGWDRCLYPGNYNLGWGGYLQMQRNVVPIVDSLYTFTGTDTLKEVVKYDYNTAFRARPSRIVKVGSLGDSTITHFRYADEYPVIYGTNALGSGVDNLLLKHVLSQPVETYVVRKDAGGGNARVTDAQLVSFKSSQPVPETIYRISNPAGLTDFVPLNLGVNPPVKDSRYLPRLKFHSYDNYGNVVEQGKDGDSKEVLVWGYQHRFIVARVTSSDYATVIALVDTNAVNNPSSDAALRTELAKIRTGLGSTNPKAKVTSYTYETVKGMTSMTDHKGETTYYEYDSYGRMKRRKDHDADQKETIWYHYQP